MASSVGYCGCQFSSRLIFSELATRIAGSGADGPVEPQHLIEGMDIPAQWWNLFHSQPLNDLIEQALKANPVVEVPADVLLVSRMMGLLSGLGKSLDSQVDLFATIMPYAQRLMMAQSAQHVAMPVAEGGN